ncbi:MAG: hypothetical protein WC614_12405 [bacterium]
MKNYIEDEKKRRWREKDKKYIERNIDPPIRTSGDEELEKDIEKVYDFFFLDYKLPLGELIRTMSKSIRKNHLLFDYYAHFYITLLTCGEYEKLFYLMVGMMFALKRDYEQIVQRYGGSKEFVDSLKTTSEIEFYISLSLYKWSISEFRNAKKYMLIAIQKEDEDSEKTWGYKASTTKHGDSFKDIARAWPHPAIPQIIEIDEKLYNLSADSLFSLYSQIEKLNEMIDEIPEKSWNAIALGPAVRFDGEPVLLEAFEFIPLKKNIVKVMLKLLNLDFAEVQKIMKVIKYTINRRKFPSKTKVDISIRINKIDNFQIKLKMLVEMKGYKDINKISGIEERDLLNELDIYPLRDFDGKLSMIVSELKKISTRNENISQRTTTIKVRQDQILKTVEELKSRISTTEESKLGAQPSKTKETKVETKSYEVFIGHGTIPREPKFCTEQEIQDFKKDSQYLVCVDEVHTELYINGKPVKTRKNVIETLSLLLSYFNIPTSTNDFPVGKGKSKSLARGIIKELRNLLGYDSTNNIKERNKYIERIGNSEYKINGDFLYCIIK